MGVAKENWSDMLLTLEMLPAVLWFTWSQVHVQWNRLKQPWTSTQTGPKTDVPLLSTGRINVMLTVGLSMILNSKPRLSTVLTLTGNSNGNFVSGPFMRTTLAGKGEEFQGNTRGGIRTLKIHPRSWPLRSRRKPAQYHYLTWNAKLHQSRIARGNPP